VLGLDPPLPLFWALLDEQEAAKIASAATVSFCEQRLRVIDCSFDSSWRMRLGLDRSV
jgi:hypothetical protein